MIAIAGGAPFGRGADIIVDPWWAEPGRLGPNKFRIEGRHWQSTLDMILARAAEGLGVSEPSEAELYKLLIYDEGSFFAAHRDTEKADHMFAHW